MNDAEKKPELQGKLREFLVMRNLYEAAARQLTLKFEILNDEFSVLYARNPIHHIESRVKTPESIAAKLMKKGLPVSIETAREHVNDIAGVRVVCSYIDDVYRVAEMLERQKDIEIVKRQDYIKTPIKAGMFNLGYLPGHGHHEVTTKRESTLAAVKAAIEMLDSDGVLLVAVYPGHEEGTLEGEMLTEYLATLSRYKLCATKVRIVNSPTSPYFFVIESK